MDDNADANAQSAIDDIKRAPQRIARMVVAAGHA